MRVSSVEIADIAEFAVFDCLLGGALVPGSPVVNLARFAHNQDVQVRVV